LVVDDSRSIAAVLSASIDALDGIQTECAVNLAQAKALLENDPDRFFIAVVDLNLPDAPDGQIVDLVQHHHIPAVVLTGMVDDEMRKSMFEKQVADYVVKQHLTGIEYVVRLVERIDANRKRLVLVVDDSRTFRAYLQTLLHSHGYRTLVAGDGREGLALLREHPEVALVISDYNMPRMDGLEMVAEMRRIRSRDDLAIIGLSDSRDRRTPPRFLKSGANDFLGKPFQLEEFYCRVDQNLDMVRYILEAREAANRDFLTRLHNRRFFFEQGARMHERARKGTGNLVAAMIDADHFKRVNDTHGHQLGDQALKAIAGVLRVQLQGKGLVGRYGGEEFACLLDLAEGKDPVSLFNRVRSEVAAIDLRDGDTRVPLSVSIGCTRVLGDSLDEMLSYADTGVYQAKSTGRNRVVCV